jgi:hypothetical protein
MSDGMTERKVTRVLTISHGSAERCGLLFLYMEFLEMLVSLF